MRTSPHSDFVPAVLDECSNREIRGVYKFTVLSEAGDEERGSYAYMRVDACCTGCFHQPTTD